MCNIFHGFFNECKSPVYSNSILCDNNVIVNDGVRRVYQFVVSREIKLLPPSN